MSPTAPQELLRPSWEQRTRARVGDRAPLRSHQVIRAARLEALVRAMASISQHQTRDRIYMLAMSSQHVRLAEGMQAGQIRRTDPDELARTAYAVVTSEIHRSLHLGRRGTSWIDEFCAFCLHGIGRA